MSCYDYHQTDTMQQILVTETAKTTATTGKGH